MSIEQCPLKAQGGYPGYDDEPESDESEQTNTERPAGDWSVAPDPVEPNKEGQELEDPRDDSQVD